MCAFVMFADLLSGDFSVIFHIDSLMREKLNSTRVYYALGILAECPLFFQFFFVNFSCLNLSFYPFW